MAAEIVYYIESTSINFLKGIGSNVNLVNHLLQDDDNKADKSSSGSGQKSPEQMTELARRRAEKQRKENGEMPGTPTKKKKTVKSLLTFMIQANVFVCGVMMVGMTHVAFPIFTYLLGDRLQKGSVLESLLTAFVVSGWLTPLWIIAKVANVFWMNELSELAYKEISGKPVQSDLAYFISDLVYSLILQLLFILQISLVSFIPVTVCGFNVFEFVFTAISYSLFAFEYKWMNRAYDVRKRLDLIDKNFAYHLGFGSPLTFVVLYFDSFWMRFISYSILFPALILCATYAKEPKEIKGIRTFIFYPAEKLTSLSFSIVRYFGLRFTLYGLLTFVVGYVWYCLWMTGWI